MKKNLYYTMVFKNSALENKSVNILLQILELPKTVLLPFLRRDMGERYFSLLLVFFIAGLLNIAIPYLDKSNLPNAHHLHIFNVLFVVISIVRYIQIRQAPSVFDFAKFSYSSGDSYAFFKKIKFRGKSFSNRTIDIFLEPIFALLIGLLFTVLFTSPAGILIMICAVCYSVSNLLRARLADHFIMDKIDEVICNEELSASFAKGEEVSPRKIPISYPNRPTNTELRNNLSGLFKGGEDDEDDPDATVIA